MRSAPIASLITAAGDYDYIVLELPRGVGMIEAELVARLADAMLFVVRWEDTDETAARTGLDDLINHHTPPIGAVLTQVDVRRHAKRAYGESVQYYRRYARYYA